MTLEESRLEIRKQRALGKLDALKWSLKFHFEGGEINQKAALQLIQEITDLLEKND